MAQHYDYAIVGGGIIGLSLGLSIYEKFPKSRVVIIDKESSTGLHASGRNSGVLHAGFYYSPDSLKAKFCANGNEYLRKIISDDELPIRNCGKVVVAQSDLDLPRLETLLQRGVANGVELELLDEKELRKFEPLAKTHSKFLWSPNTAVSDPILVTNSIQRRYLAAGGEIRFNSECEITQESELRIEGSPVIADRIINAAGGGAIHLAHKVGVGLHYSQLPVLGLYKVATQREIGLQRLVYPVPNPVNPFLGVHFTLTVDGSVKIGPTAIPILGREQYSFTSIPDWKDLASSGASLASLLSTSPRNLVHLAKTELPKMATRVLVSGGEALVPNLPKDIKWKPKKPGIRAQLIDRRSGQFEMDYVVEKNENQVHILNAVSPGWTSSMPFAKWVVDKFL